MRNDHRWIGALLGVALGAVLAAPAWGEVRVRTGRHGDYRMTQILTGGVRSEGRIWGAVSARPDSRLALNLEGDWNGDLWPRIAESNASPHHPWAVWSRYNCNGREYDLAWSRWAPSGWEPIAWVDQQGLSGDDLDADLAFDPEGRPYVVWWRDEGGQGRIYLSLFLVNRWMAPYAVTDGSIDSRFPIVELTADADTPIRVEYETPEGIVSQLVTFDEPVTITDNIDPLDHLRMEHEPVLIGSLP